MKSQPAPQSQDERDLERMQGLVTKGEQARKMRDDLAFRLWWKGGLTQADIASRLDRADRRAGGKGISLASTQKSLFRMRRALQHELLQHADNRNAES